MQAVWIGHSFSYEVDDKNYSVIFWSHADLISPQGNPQIAIAVSATSGFSLLSMTLRIVEVKRRWLASLGLKGYTKQGV